MVAGEGDGRKRLRRSGRSENVSGVGHTRECRSPYPVEFRVDRPIILPHLETSFTGPKDADIICVIVSDRVDCPYTYGTVEWPVVSKVFAIMKKVVQLNHLLPNGYSLS